MKLNKGNNFINFPLLLYAITLILHRKNTQIRCFSTRITTNSTVPVSKIVCESPKYTVSFQKFNQLFIRIKSFIKDNHKELSFTTFFCFFKKGLTNAAESKFMLSVRQHSSTKQKTSVRTLKKK